MYKVGDWRKIVEVGKDDGWYGKGKEGLVILAIPHPLDDYSCPAMWEDGYEYGWFKTKDGEFECFHSIKTIPAEKPIMESVQ